MLRLSFHSIRAACYPQIGTLAAVRRPEYGGRLCDANARRPGRPERQHVGSTSEPTLHDLSEALVAVYGTDYGIHSPTWISTAVGAVTGLGITPWANRVQLIDDRGSRAGWDDLAVRAMGRPSPRRLGRGRSAGQDRETPASDG